MIITIVSVLIIVSLALFNQFFPYFSRRVGIAFRYARWLRETPRWLESLLWLKLVTDKERLSAVSCG
jgi:hypothetical protein